MGVETGLSDGGCKIINGAFHLQVSVKRASTLVIIVILKHLLYNGVQVFKAVGQFHVKSICILF